MKVKKAVSQEEQPGGPLLARNMLKVAPGELDRSVIFTMSSLENGVQKSSGTLFFYFWASHRTNNMK